MAAERSGRFPPYPAANEATMDPSALLDSTTLAAGHSKDLFQYTTDSASNPPPQRLTKLPRYLVGISSKAYFTHAQTIAYARQLLDFPPTDPSLLRIFFIPSFPGVSTTSLLIQQREAAASAPPPLNLLLGAQECHFAPAGAHTGSVPASELAELGCSLVELGHAERRRAPLSESDAMVAAKARMAIAAGLVPLVCIGERMRASDPEEALREMRPQLDSVLAAVGSQAHILLGYEPVWAIGQKEPAPADYVCAVVDRIREATRERSGDVKILYGGSAKPGIWGKLKGSVDGLFLGRFGHDVRALQNVVEEISGR